MSALLEVKSEAALGEVGSVNEANGGTVNRAGPDESRIVETTAYKLARKALAAAGGDIRRATDEVIQAVSSQLVLDAGVNRQLHDDLLRIGAYTVVTSVIRHQRNNAGATSKRPVEPEPGGRVRTAVKEDQSARVLALAKSNLFAFTLPGGRRLGDAVKSEVQAAAEFYTKQAVDMGAKGRWLAAIAAALKSDKSRVSSALSEAQLDRLRSEALNAA